jgi:nicotinate-nucleotide adenylyltransferase
MVSGAFFLYNERVGEKPLKGGAAVPKERIGIMGGSFNPIHDRHMEIAACAKREHKLDRVIFLPAGNPPHKHEGLADAEYRFEMTRLAVSGMQGFSVSRMEIDREGVTYTVDTLTRLQKQMPGAELYYLIGEDTLFDLPNWRRPDKVFTLCRFLVCSRETGELAQNPQVRELEERGAKFSFLSLPPDAESATAIREALARGETPGGVRPQVLEYIRIMGLYGCRESPQGAAACYPRLRQLLTDKRLLHSLLVASTARDLARRHGVSEDQAAMAGLMHDCAKCLPLAQQQRIARESRLLLDRETLQSENLLHGPVGAVVAEREFGVRDPNVLSAIRCHTTGKVGMLPLDMIVYLADKIEPSRRSYPALEKVRELAQSDLVAAMRYSLESTLAYVRTQKTTPHPTTQRVADWLERLASNRQEPAQPIKE